MSRILLLSLNTMIEPYPVYPLGMAIVASALSSRGHKVSQFDFLKEGASLAKLQSAVRKFKPDYVGVSLRNIDNVDSFTAETTWALASYKERIQAVRDVTGAPVVLGGPAFSIMPEEILEYLGADYGIVGDGGTRFSDLIEQLGKGCGVAPISRSDGTACTEDVPVRPLWNKRLVNYYTKHSGLIGVTTKRGCPHNCVYCTYPMLEGNQYIWRDPGLVADDMEQLKRDHQVDTIFFTDSVFNDIDGFYLHVAEEILRRGIEIQWSAYFRPHGMEDKDLELLKRSGLYAVEAGTDAAHDTTLAGLNKSFSFDDAVLFNEACLRAGVPCAHHILFGGPGETESTVREGLDNLLLLKGCVIFGFSGIRILPGTILHQRAIDEGFVKKEDSLLKTAFYFSPEIDIDSMNDAILNAFKRQRYWMFPPSAANEMQRRMEDFGFKGPQWHRILSYKKRER
jgi:lipid biosynthesis B12-binding/radical SAM protein